jgi:hypothetical protein
MDPLTMASNGLRSAPGVDATKACRMVAAVGTKDPSEVRFHGYEVGSRRAVMVVGARICGDAKVAAKSSDVRSPPD